jgi:hypothetical protein
MANSPGICTAFKVNLMLGNHALGTSVATSRSPAKDTIFAALYLASATITGSTNAYTTTGEVTGTNYTAGGVQVTNATEPTNDGTTAHWTPSASIVYTTVTLSTAFDAVLLYNTSTPATNDAIAVFTFGSQTITAGTFTLTMPSNNGSTGLIRLA